MMNPGVDGYTNFLSQFSKLSYFNLLDLSDFLMHYFVPRFGF